LEVPPTVNAVNGVNKVNKVKDALFRRLSRLRPGAGKMPAFPAGFALAFFAFSIAGEAG